MVVAVTSTIAGTRTAYNRLMQPPIIFLDIDDVLVLNEKYGGWDALEALAHEVEHHPELWQLLVFPAGRDNLRALHEEFSPTYVISST